MVTSSSGSRRIRSFLLIFPGVGGSCSTRRVGSWIVVVGIVWTWRLRARTCVGGLSKIVFSPGNQSGRRVREREISKRRYPKLGSRRACPSTSLHCKISIRSGKWISIKIRRSCLLFWVCLCLPPPIRVLCRTLVPFLPFPTPKSLWNVFRDSIVHLQAPK